MSGPTDGPATASTTMSGSGLPGDMRATYAWARDYAQELLEPLGRRWHHTQAVAATAETFTDVLGDADGMILATAAYLHDLGYAPGIAVTGFHALDGARHLHDLGHSRLAALVAHHTGAVYEATLRHLAQDLARFPNELSTVTAALAYCDLTNGPGGQPTTPEDRLTEVERRYGRHHLVPTALRSAWPYLTECVKVARELQYGDGERIDAGLARMARESQAGRVAARLRLEPDSASSGQPRGER